MRPPLDYILEKSCIIWIGSICIWSLSVIFSVISCLCVYVRVCSRVILCVCVCVCLVSNNPVVDVASVVLRFAKLVQSTASILRNFGRKLSLPPKPNQLLDQGCCRCCYCCCIWGT